MMTHSFARKAPTKVHRAAFGVRWIWFLAFVLALTPGGGSHADNGAKPVRICAAENHVIHQMVVDTVVEAYRRIGLETAITWLPNRRSLIAANAGDCDAEILRIPGLEKRFENLRPVEVVLTHLEGVAFVNADKQQSLPDIRTWADLQGLDTYIILGEVYAEAGTKGMPVGQVRTYHQLFRMLEKRDLDVGIGIHAVGVVELARNFPTADIRIHGEPLTRAPMYHYVHKDYTYVIEALTKTLRHMAASGEIEQLNTAALERLKTPGGWAKTGPE